VISSRRAGVWSRGRGRGWIQARASKTKAGGPLRVEPPTGPSPAQNALRFRLRSQSKGGGGPARKRGRVGRCAAPTKLGGWSLGGLPDGGTTPIFGRPAGREFWGDGPLLRPTPWTVLFPVIIAGRQFPPPIMDRGAAVWVVCPARGNPGGMDRGGGVPATRGAKPASEPPVKNPGPSPPRESDRTRRSPDLSAAPQSRAGLADPGLQVGRTPRPHTRNLPSIILRFHPLLGNSGGTGAQATSLRPTERPFNAGLVPGDLAGLELPCP